MDFKCLVCMKETFLNVPITSVEVRRKIVQLLPLRRAGQPKKQVDHHPYRGMTMDGGTSGVLVRGQDIMLEMLRQVQGYFRTNDPSKKTEGWRNLDRSAMVAICSSRISKILDSDDDPAMPSGTDKGEDNQGQQVLEQAVVQEILLGLVEKRLHETQLQVTQGPVDIQFLKQQFVTMARDSEYVG
ncbi:hypothetical protein DYB32_004139 [Aphanomyces invadans]|uniref:Uncharacterized protein n=1 Tax=Aphanomyces invadans TaxID=157072 RepID=A0A418AYF3_9STRA|nr:hypothetical protein DYB32_004139 [Aphanomyces invadans]